MAGSESAGFSRLLRSCQNSQLWTKGYIFRRREERAATIALPLAGEFVADASASDMEGRLLVRREDGCAMMVESSLRCIGSWRVSIENREMAFF